MGSGYHSCIISSGGGVVNSGLCNIITSSVYSVIDSGICNHISTATYSFISTGLCNCITANYSAILGGSKNTASALYSGVFGCLLTNSCACSFMSNQLRASNLCGTAVTLCTDANGTIQRSTSDCRMKTCICDINYGLCDIMKLHPVSFYWCNYLQSNSGYERQIGFVAQEVKPVLPETVGCSSEDIYSLDSIKIIPVLVKAIQELKACIDAITTPIS